MTQPHSHISHTAARISVRIIFKSTLFPKSKQLPLTEHAAPTSALVEQLEWMVESLGGRMDGSFPPIWSLVFGIEGAQTKTEVGHGQKACRGKKLWRQVANVAQVQHVERESEGEDTTRLRKKE